MSSDEINRESNYESDHSDGNILDMDFAGALDETLDQIPSSRASERGSLPDSSSEADTSADTNKIDAGTSIDHTDEENSTRHMHSTDGPEESDLGLDHMAGASSLSQDNPLNDAQPESNDHASRRVYNKGLSITINTPHKVNEGSAAFVTYLVTSTRPGMEPERVRRRFSEFSRLYTQLLTEFPASAIPPLPDHSRFEYLAGDRFSDAFTHRRAAALERFLFRVTCHPDLSSSRTLAAFLTPSNRQNQPNGGAGTTSPDGVLDQLSDTLLNAFSKAKNQSKEMIEARERADRFEHAISMIDKAATHLVKHEGLLNADLNDMSKQATRLAALDKGVSKEFDILSRTSQALSEAFGELHNSNDAQFAGALKDMTRYVKALKQMLKQREQKQIDYEALVDYLRRTEQDFATLQSGNTSTSPSSFLRTKVNDLRGVDKEQSRQARQQRLEMRMSELRIEANRAKQVSDQFEEIAKQEVQIFEATEALEMRSCLAGFTKAHIAFYRRVLNDCRAIEAELE